MKSLKFTFWLLLSILAYSCSDLYDGEIDKIGYGTSFGECIGFCKKELVMENGSKTFKMYSWYPSIQTLSQTDNLPELQWNYFKKGLNTGAFFSLPETIGCPDCADGGAEWLEVVLTNGEKHKVTFEYLNEPAILTNYIDSLRDVMSRSAYSDIN